MSEHTSIKNIRSAIAVLALFILSVILLLASLLNNYLEAKNELVITPALLMLVSAFVMVKVTIKAFVSAQQHFQDQLSTLTNKAQHSESRFAAITEQSIEGITVANNDGRYTFVNPAFCKMMGYSEQELLNMTVFDVKAPDQDHSSFERTKTTSSGEPFEVLLQRKDGSTFISEVVGNNIVINDEHQVLGTIRDITEQVKAEERTQTLYQAVDQSPISVIIFDITGKIQYINSAVELKTGFEPDAVIGKPFSNLFSEQDATTSFDVIWQRINKQQPWEGEIQSTKHSGELFWEYAHISPVKDIYGKTIHFLAIKEDITTKKQQENKILQQAHYDNLTNLPNRFLSLDRLTHMIDEAKRNQNKVALLFIDLDDFKKINDTLGHETGDKVLVAVANRLHSTIRAQDTVGRLGGDEFIVVLSGLTDPTDARLIAESLLETFANAFSIEERDLILTASIGIAIYPTDGDNTSVLLRNSDSAMYHAKELGRNNYAFFTEDMNRQVARRLELEEQIHNALSRKEFEIYYQTIISVENNQIVGAEALLRWNNETLGEVSPEEFIPIAEQTGLIIPIGEFVLSEALKSAAAWQKQFLPSFHIAINLSPRQFRDPNLVTVIINTVNKSKITDNSLNFEITEGVLLNSHNQLNVALTTLNKLKINITMDDFGTGYSSLSYLRHYPFKMLKIDHSFIKDITKDPSDRRLIKAAIAMAHSLHLKVIAEGVESEEQLNYLKELNCDYAQGFLFNQPLNHEEFNHFLAHNFN